ncbi:MAG: hypothetical protein R3276_06185 [Marinobacter sp.]|nr:hypothetical protein [Marinobacter sp.]
MTLHHWFVRAVVVWVMIVPLAIINASIRELLLAPSFGSGMALPVSGAMLSGLILLVAWVAVPYLKPANHWEGWRVGLVWLGLTLAFEVLLGRLGAGLSWSAVLATLDPRSGDLFVLVLVTTLVAPWLMAKCRNLL